MSPLNVGSSHTASANLGSDPDRKVNTQSRHEHRLAENEVTPKYKIFPNLSIRWISLQIGRVFEEICPPDGPWHSSLHFPGTWSKLISLLSTQGHSPSKGHSTLVQSAVGRDCSSWAIKFLLSQKKLGEDLSTALSPVRNWLTLAEFQEAPGTYLYILLQHRPKLVCLPLFNQPQAMDFF